MAFESFEAFKATNDSIKPVCLHNLNYALIKRLKNLYNACIVLHYTPKSLRESKIIFIPKPNKLDYSTIGAWRPITLNSFLFKGLEKIVLWYIQKNVPNLISSMQHAFRPMYEVNTALSTLCSSIEKAILRSEFAVCVFWTANLHS